MTWRERFWIWKLRVQLRIGLDVSDRTISDGLANLEWRFAAAGHHGEMPMAMGRIASVDREGAIRIIRMAAVKRVPDTWWDRA